MEPGLLFRLQLTRTFDPDIPIDSDTYSLQQCQLCGAGPDPGYTVASQRNNA